MGSTSKPRRGSRAYSPRKRARSINARIRSWPEVDGPARLQGFAGYKAGMTHAIIVDPRPKSTTSGQEIQIPVTIIEVPPMKVAAIRVYKDGPYGLQCLTEVWADKLDRDLERLLPIRKAKEEKGKKKAKGKEKEEDEEGDGKKKASGELSVEDSQVDEVRILMHTMPRLIFGVPKKKPDMIEVRIGGGTIKDRLTLARDYLGKEIKITDYVKEPGKVVDLIAVTKGKGFQGAIKRWGVKLLVHKNSKHRRQTGTMGPWHPNYVMSTVPLAGQMGFHQRTDLNKTIIKVGENGEEVTPSGGFVRYGKVANPYLLIYGTIPGPAKRMIRIRDATRYHGKMYKWEINYLSTASKQGR
jgi:large subunit ribosomal protein L3